MKSNANQNWIDNEKNLFPERNRPVDENGFPIQLGQGAHQMNGRKALNDRYLDTIVVRGVLKAEVDRSGIKTFNLRLSSDGIGEEDPTSFVTVTGQTLLEYVPGYRKEDYFKDLKVGTLGWKIRDGMLIVPQKGVYLVSFYTETFYGPGYDYTNGSSKILASLIGEEVGGTGMSTICVASKMGLSFPDYSNGCIQVACEAGAKLGMKYGHKIQSGSSKNTILVRGTIAVTKL